MAVKPAVTVFVPATSANVGAGFDSLGLALALGNTVAMEEAEGCSVVLEGGAAGPAGPAGPTGPGAGLPGAGDDIPTGADNLVVQAVEYFYKQCGKPFKGVALRQKSPIPVTRGLGSSSACIVAGLYGANALLGWPCARAHLLAMAAGIEGHPDNVAPALLGGLVASCLEGGRVHSVKKEISPGLVFGAFVPDYTLPTRRAREALPKTVPLADAVFNLSRAVLCQAAFCEGRTDLLAAATGDRLHQPARLPLMPGAAGVFALAKKAGAAAVFVSGAGPTVLAVVRREDEGFAPAAEAALEEARRRGEGAGRFTLAMLEADNQGARLI